MYKLLILDLDGTIADTSHTIGRSLASGDINFALLVK